jgi:hypothetical protein
MVVALLALFFSLAGLGVAAGVVPLAKRALVADNARKLQGKTAAEVAASVKTPSVAASVTIRSSGWSLGAGAITDATAACSGGEKVTGGGFDHSSGDVLVLDSRPGGDGASWKVLLANLSPTKGAAGNVFAACAH